MANRIISKKIKVANLTIGQKIALFKIAKINGLFDKLSDFQNHIKLEKEIFLLLNEETQIKGYALPELKEYRMHGKSVFVSTQGKSILESVDQKQMFLTLMLKRFFPKSQNSVPSV